MNEGHLLTLSNPLGVFEHSLGAEPRREYGFCVDDVARALILLTRADMLGEPVSLDARLLADRSLTFVLDAQSPDGLFVNRRAVDGSWYGSPAAEDHWGRALWSLGDVAGSSSMRRDEALEAFELGAVHRPPFLRSMVFAGLGAASVVRALPGNDAGVDLLRAAAARVPQATSIGWPWPEPRLTYANAAIPELLIRAGSLLEEPSMLKRGLDLLEWLMEVEMIGGHLSMTPVGGWGPGELRPGFDQQPIEVTALVDACVAAHAATGDVSWLIGVERGAAWFDGDNDAGIPMGNPYTGGGHDGLHPHGRNENQGAESTLAYLMVVQTATHLIKSRYPGQAVL
jgi:hypothetical protein